MEEPGARVPEEKRWQTYPVPRGEGGQSGAWESLAGPELLSRPCHCSAPPGPMCSGGPPSCHRTGLSGSCPSLPQHPLARAAPAASKPSLPFLPPGLRPAGSSPSHGAPGRPARGPQLGDGAGTSLCRLGPPGEPCSLPHAPRGPSRGAFLPHTSSRPWTAPAGAWRPAPLGWRVMRGAEQAGPQRSACDLACRQLAPLERMILQGQRKASATTLLFPVALPKRHGAAPRASPWGRAVARRAGACSQPLSGCVPSPSRENEKAAGLIWPIRWQLASVQRGNCRG